MQVIRCRAREPVTKRTGAWIWPFPKESVGNWAAHPYARSALDGGDTASKNGCKAAPDQGNPPAAAAAAKPAKVANRAPAETRSRGEVYADTRQSCEDGTSRAAPDQPAGG
jgi:hypothetical protein